jgi:hypothetical protein
MIKRHSWRSGYQPARHNHNHSPIPEQPAGAIFPKKYVAAILSAGAFCAVKAPNNGAIFRTALS